MIYLKKLSDVGCFRITVCLLLLLSCSENETDNDENILDTTQSACNPASANKAPSSSWFKSYNGSGDESHGHFILSCNDGGYLQVGETGFIPNSKIFAVKVNQNGELIWMQEIGQSGNNMGNAAIETNDAYIIVGALNQNSSFIKLNKSSGEVLDFESHDIGGADAFEDIIVYQDGFLAVGYNFAQDDQNTFFTEGQASMSILDADGALINTISLNKSMAQAYRITEMDDEYIISGLSEDAEDFALLKVDASLNIIWNNTYGGASSDHNFGMDVDNEGSIFLTGHTLSNTVNWDTYTMKINPSGQKIWEVKIGNPRGFDPNFIHDETWDIKTTPDGGCIIVAGSGDEYENYAAFCDENNTTSNQWVVYLIKFNATGDIEWQTTYENPEGGDWAGEAITLSNDGGALVALDNGSFGFLKVNPF